MKNQENPNDKIAEFQIGKERSETTEKDYARLIAAQNESERRLKILSVKRTLDEEYKKKNRLAVISGICFAGIAAAVHFSFMDIQQAVQTEINALNSFSALKDYLLMISPATYGTIAASAMGLSNYIKHKRNYEKARHELSDILNNPPEAFQDEVEKQAKTR